MTYPSTFSRLTVTKENLAIDEGRRLETFQLGIWKVSILKRTQLNFGKQFLGLKKEFGYFRHLAIDVYTLEPMLATVFTLNELWCGVHSAVLLYFSSQILRIIEIGLVQGATEIGAILKAVAVRIFFVVFAAVLQWESERILPTLKTRIMTHFELFLMQAQLRIDLPTFQEPRSKAMKALSQLVLIVQVSLSTGSPLFAVACIIKSVFLILTGRTLWNTPHIVHTDNEHRQRMKALNSMSAPGYRSEVLGSDIVDYIINEYRKATRLLGGLSDEWAPIQYMIRTSPAWEITNDLLRELLIAYILCNSLHPLPRETLAFIYCNTPTIVTVPKLGHSVRCY
ncbi:hypothetical protein EV421DRAFT_2042067 [Armillaria borealis]|uniref:Uncharacterized protein n=1 Tax=Armillaria borealis TaxID=47425 RepID=A0AA39ME16_9AGAR|nr:hypothetical protein EV421DRAFT_2042067 [Armillaria borealis]